MRAIVIGAGIAGAAAAIALRRAGHDVIIHERADAILPMGAALSLWPNAVEALRRLNLLEPIAASAAPLRTLLLADRGGLSLAGPHRICGEAYLVTRTLLQSTLLAALADNPLRYGSTLAHVEQDGAGATAIFANGRREAADLIVIADGIWSATANDILGSAPAFCGYGGMLALSDPVGEGDGMAVEYWGDGERFGVFDLGGGQRYWFHMRNAASAGSIDYGIADAAIGWPDAVRAAVAATPADRLIPFAIHARPAPHRLGRGRILLVGDAAHAMQPNLGQGACQALEDAVFLGSLARDMPADKIVAAFERARLRRIRQVVKGSAAAAPIAHARRRWVGQVGRTLLSAVPNRINRRAIERFHSLPSHLTWARPTPNSPSVVGGPRADRRYLPQASYSQRSLADRRFPLCARRTRKTPHASERIEKENPRRPGQHGRGARGRKRVDDAQAGPDVRDPQG